MFIIIWKYRVLRENSDAFRFEYASGGVWEKLFSQSEDFIGSYLHRGVEENNTYILIDRWTTKAAYEDFLFNNHATYQKLSKLLQHLYETEEKIGSFLLVE